jgi:SAM-dependent methyltransferase
MSMAHTPRRQSVFYRHPLLYELGIHFLYLNKLKILKKIVGHGQSVFEPACGFGRMKKYLYPDCAYSGIDLNDKFISFGRKKNRDIQLGDILNEENYRRADIILLCDILHHLQMPEIHRLFQIAGKFAKRIVIIEPTFVALAARKNSFSHLLGKLMTRVDSDGFNEISHWMSREEYNELFISLNAVIPILSMTIRHHYYHDFVEIVLT